jgi:uracil-DNA glycosylase family 4
MHLDRSELAAILAFYAEAGVDTLLTDAPVDRFTQVPRSSPASRVPQSAPDFSTAIRNELAPIADLPDVADAAESPSRRAAPAMLRAGVPPRSSLGPSRPPVDAPLAPDAAVMAAREAARAAKSLDELRAILAGFTGCGLRATAQRLVFADGNPQARVMFVGEAPGRDEDIQGLPFVGRSGQLLDRMMAAIGLNRTSAYVGNVIPWRPPGNRTPTPQETETCLPFTKRQIELADPDILVCLGAPSALALLGLKDGIRRTRGRWHNYHTGAREIRAIATFHPAYLLRSPLEKRLAWRDFLAIKTALAE